MGEESRPYEDWTDEQIEAEIRAQKMLLAETDYKSLKHADGVISDEDYVAIAEMRQGFRDNINELEDELEARKEDEAAESAEVE